MTAILAWFEGNSHTLSATITITASGAAADGATITGLLEDANGTDVWTGSMTEVGSTGVYTATIDPASAVVNVGQTYWLTVSGTRSSRSVKGRAKVQVEIQDLE